jgi:Na+-driven multidrug efflux pump
LGIFLAVAVNLFLGGLLLLFSEFFIGLLIDDTSVTRDFAYQRMFLELPLYFLCGIMEVFSGALRGMGKSVTNTIVSLIASCAFRILWVNVIFLFVERNIGWIFISKPISWLLVAIFNGLFFLIYYRKCANEKLQLSRQ